MSRLLDKGWRFVRRAGFIGWMHPGDMQSGDIDCTDMDDEALQREVCKAVGIFKFCTVPTTTTTARAD